MSDEITRLTAERDKWMEDAHRLAQNSDYWRMLWERGCARLTAERDALKAEVERRKQDAERFAASSATWHERYEAERQRARMPEELVEQIRKDSIGTECPTWARCLLRDILAWHEGGE